jgi:hypothetical protein
LRTRRLLRDRPFSDDRIFLNRRHFCHRPPLPQRTLACLIEGAGGLRFDSLPLASAIAACTSPSRPRVAHRLCRGLPSESCGLFDEASGLLTRILDSLFASCGVGWPWNARVCLRPRQRHCPPRVWECDEPRSLALCAIASTSSETLDLRNGNVPDLLIFE